MQAMFTWRLTPATSTIANLWLTLVISIIFPGIPKHIAIVLLKDK
jgi:hypothetical protein